MLIFIGGGIDKLAQPQGTTRLMTDKLRLFDNWVKNNYYPEVVPVKPLIENAPMVILGIGIAELVFPLLVLMGYNRLAFPLLPMVVGFTIVVNNPFYRTLTYAGRFQEWRGAFLNTCVMMALVMLIGYRAAVPKAVMHRHPSPDENQEKQKKDQ